MFILKIENAAHEILTLTQSESKYQVIKVAGLNPPAAQLNTSVIGNSDGSKFNSARLNTRNIVITLKLNGDIEKNRLALYRFFNTKNYCKVYYKNGARDVFIEGYIETVEVDLFEKVQLMQISVLCPNPYFKSAQLITDDISKVLSLFEFPFAIDVDDPIEFSNISSSQITNVRNDSESENGIIIRIEVLGSISKIRIVNIETGEEFTLTSSFIKNDYIVIDTNKGYKSISLIRNGITSNLFTAMKKGSNFFQLNVGDNYFSYLVDDGANDEKIHILFEHYNTYRGV